MAMQLITDITLELTGDERLYMASAKQGDKRTRFIRIALTNNGKVFTIPTGYIVIANIKKPDKHFCYNECTVTDNKVMVELTNQALAAAGTAHCDIEIRDAQNVYVLSSQAFTIEIEETNRNDAAIESCNEITALEKKVQQYIDNIVSTKNDILSVEAAMKVAEAARASAEVDRINAEARRKKSEQDRETAETARQQQLQIMQEATGAANNAASSTETVMHVFIASAGVFVTCMFPVHQFLYLFSTSHGLFSIPLRHTQNPSLPKTSSGKCSNRTGCSLPS